MQKTEYLKLNKPDSTDFFSVDHQNQNMERIDAELEADKKEIENTKSEVDKVNSDLSGKLDNSAVGADSLLSKITTSWVDTPTDDTYFIRQNTGGESTFGRVKFSTLWSYIKGKADKVYAALTHTHTKSQITDFPTSMPANGGNSATVNGHTVNSDVPANAKFTDTVYTHPTNSGYKHIPSGGSDGQILKWSSDGTAKWSDNILVDSETNNTSTNPVQNKVITAALDGKMPVYSYNGGTFDADDLTSPAIHLINSGGTNLPASCSGGVLLVDGSSQTTQYFFPLYNGDNRIHTRYKYHGTEWTDWEILGLSTSQSTAITTAGKYALDAVQNNASVSGTLANKISNIGTVISDSETNVSGTGGWTTGCTITLPPGGTYLVMRKAVDKNGNGIICGEHYSTGKYSDATGTSKAIYTNIVTVGQNTQQLAVYYFGNENAKIDLSIEAVRIK